MNRPLRHASALLTLLLAACGSSPAVRYFDLAPADAAMEAVGTTPAPDAPVLVLGPVLLPDYLKRPQHVTRDGARVHVDEHNRWAEPLDAAVPRVLAMNLGSAVPAVVVVASPYGPPARYRLTAHVLRFEAGAAGDVELIVQWSVTASEGGTLQPPRTSRYTVPADGAAPDARAVAMSEALALFSREVAALLRREIG